MFVDKVIIHVRSGTGGHGCVSFRRRRNLPKGGPDGGDGGRGGDIVFEATANEQSLVALKYMNHYEAENGRHGMGNQKNGRCGRETVIKVPVGTIFKNVECDCEFLADLSEPCGRFVAVRGGAGGRGNRHFVSSRNQAPRRAEEGAEGETRHLELELKLLADVGLVGYPNAGKSTLLGSVTNATPETAPYPFTTLTPNVGTTEFDDFFRITLADIPGLVDGAHRNVGLGHDFLRHIERTNVLLYVLDMAATDGRQPWDDLTSLRHELECYKPGMSQRASIIAANKMDADTAAANLTRLRGKTDLPVFPVCAILNENTDAILQALREMLADPE